MRDPSDVTWTKAARTAPKTPLPPGAWDCHSHVFGPFDQYPLAIGTPYIPPIGPATEHLAHLDAAGFSKSCLIHAGANGLDHSGVLDAVAAAPDRLICTGVVAPDAGLDLLAAYDAKGMRGLRFSDFQPTYGGPKPPGVLGLESLKDFAPMLQELGWFACVWARCEHLVAQMAWLRGLEVPIVIDHMASFDLREGLKGETFQHFLAALKDNALYVKLTPLRVTEQLGTGFEAVRPFHEALLEAAPDRMLWGSDWPYIMINDPTPDIGAQIDLFDAWTPDAGLRQRVFVDNPEAFFAQAPGLGTPAGRRSRALGLGECT